MGGDPQSATVKYFIEYNKQGNFLRALPNGDKVVDAI